MATEAPRLLGAASRLDSAQRRTDPVIHSRIRTEPLRFLLCGDFRLGKVCQPQPGLDPQLEQRLISAPYAAADKVVELAIIEQVDFVILVGQLFSPTEYGVQEPAFLMRQFARLGEHLIPVVWSKARQSLSQESPDWIAWPANVIELDSSARQSFLFEREDGRSAAIECVPRSRSMLTEAEELRIGVSLGVPAVANSYASQEFDIIVASGGAWTAADNIDHSIPADFSRGIGPQGRNFDEYGPHGCWLITMESRRQVHVDFVPCDAVRWRLEMIEIADDTTWDELLRTCELQSRRAISSCHALTLIKLQLFGHGPLSRVLWDPSRMKSFVSSLRQSLQVESGHEIGISTADVELIFDPREEARLRSEKSAWAAWSSAIDDLERESTLPQWGTIGSELGHINLSDRETDSTVPVPHFKKLRRTALRKLIQRVGDK